MDAKQLQALGKRVATSHAKQSKIHGPEHWQHVGETGAAIASLIGPRVNRDVVSAFAALHDTQRLDDGEDAQHGERAAQKALELRADELSYLYLDDFERLLTALTIHSKPTLSSDPTIATCLDADRMTLARVGKTPSLAYMSTVQYGYLPESHAEFLIRKATEKLQAGSVDSYSWDKFAA